MRKNAIVVAAAATIIATISQKAGQTRCAAKKVGDQVDKAADKAKESLDNAKR